MSFQEFRMTFQNYPMISTMEIEKLFPHFDFKNLVNWQKKKYIQKIRNSWYRLTENTINTETMFFISNHIYAPSYVSLESALSFYGFIPEGVFSITAISTLKTQHFETPIGHFMYKNVKPNIFFGYQLVPFSHIKYKMAEPEKAILDYLYLHPEMETEDHFFEWRLNVLEVCKQVNFETLKNYSNHIQSKALTKRVELLIKYIQNA